MWASTHKIVKKLRYETDKTIAALLHEAVLALEQRYMAQKIAQQAEADAEAPRRLAATRQRSSAATATPQPTTAA
jgi:arginine/lysine/ornithine decarboxylase